MIDPHLTGLDHGSTSQTDRPEAALPKPKLDSKTYIQKSGATVRHNLRISFQNRFTKSFI